MAAPRPLNPRDERAVRAYLRRLAGPLPMYTRRDCPDPALLHLTRRTFRFRGRGRDVLVVVRLQPVAMISLLRAMLDAPTIQVTGTTFGSYRSCALQKELHDKYLAGTGYLAAPPGRSGHNQGVCADLYKPSATDRRAMLRHGFHDLLPQDPPHFNRAGRY